MTSALVILLFSTLAYHYSRTKETKLFNEAYRENNKISISSILKFKEKELEKTASDYSVWDDMVNFINSSDKSWAKDNIEASIYTLDMSIATVYSADYSLIYSIQDSINFGKERFSISSSDIKSALAGKKNCHFFLMTPQGLMEISGSPIVPSSDVNKTSPPAGYLIWGRLWNHKFITNLENSCNAMIEVIPLKTSSDLKIIKNSNDLNNNAITFFLLGSMGNKIAQVDFLSKNQFQMKHSYFYFYTLIPALIALIVGFIFFFAFRTWISMPLNQISQSLKKENPSPLLKITESNREFHAIAQLIVAFFEAKNKVERNIQERKLAEERILKLSTALEQSSETIVITDAAGTIEYVNKRFYELTGFTRSEAIGKNTRILKSGIHTKEFYKDLWDTISSGSIWKGEILNRKKNGELYWENASIAPIKNLDGVIINYIAVKGDITEQKHDEEMLRKYADELKESNQSKDKFFSILAHDLKSPFHSLLGYTELLNNEYDTLTDAERRKFIVILRNSTKSVYELVENLLQWSRLQSDRLVYAPEVFDISEEIEYTVDVLRAIALKKNIELANLVTLPVMVMADKNMTRSVLQNLISNALKFTAGGGSVIIEAASKGGNIEFSIRDTGIGMSAEEMALLFRIDISFTRKGTAKETGTGLGLILARELVRKNKGDITVESEVNKGSTFRFTLPQA